MTKLSQKRLKEVLDYDPENGVFMWKERISIRVSVGAAAGTKRDDGYVEIGVDGERFLAHRLAWFYELGVWPEREIDHRNGIRDDNRWDNLREASHRQNLQNIRKAKSGSRSGFLGVTFHKSSRLWHARIVVDYKTISLGYFKCQTAAYLLGYLPAKRRLHEFGTL